MVREIHIVDFKFLKGYILYDGPREHGRRQEYSDLASLLDDLPGELKGFDARKRINIYLEMSNDEVTRSIKLVLGKKFPKVEYINGTQ